ncbi:undecaprenyl-phosphate glucose phosphotransferase [Oceanisphaera pacifica]|uniref:Undecaprenyl-phosphate glucose phosphotransferase n=1 Tax=Oceanisphaera pacifica TaxID=2818389 RepID=A0ABS3NHP0_9GAMM|nr:undecaprenyl-phosphate glucose phosphotransferase [Oceanisphaera pacifica]MBO1519751.1 undecaprenyl-phosphate glucose phosphotransferase [Oceanisphaera pacifica]
MSKKTSKITDHYPAQFIIPIFDAVFLLVGALLANALRFDSVDLHDRYWLALIIIILVVTFINNSVGAYDRWRITKTSTLLIRQLLIWLIVGVLITSVIYITQSAERYSRLWIGLTLVISFILSGTMRVIIQLLLRRARLQGRALRSVFLVGPSTNIKLVGKGMRGAPTEGYCIAGVHRLRDIEINNEDLAKLAHRVAESGAQEVWICVPLEMGALVRSVFYALRHQTVEVRFIPEFKDMQLLNHRMSEVAGQFSFDLSITPMSGLSLLIKRLEDIVLGALISVLILPICLVVAVLIKLSSPGPILFKQYRTGVNGKKFKVYKFRTMKVHQESSGQVTQASRQDPRITRVGAFLRRTSLDELPQFYNVLQGRMSIVGPRPHALAHNEHYKELVESYMKRHKVKPGITGWAQVNGFRGETDTIEKMEARVEHDLWYINNWSLWLDLRIIFWTIFKGFINKNAY